MELDNFPTLDIPGKGPVTVKLDFYAQYQLEAATGRDILGQFEKVREMIPHDVDGQRVPGKVSVVFLMDVLAACTFSQLQMTGRDLAQCFSNPLAFIDIAKVILEAYTAAFPKKSMPTDSGLDQPAITDGPKPN